MKLQPSSFKTPVQSKTKTSQELRIAALRVVGCQGVKVFLLKDVIITTSVTTVILIPSQFTTVTVTTVTVTTVTVTTVTITTVTIIFFYFLFYLKI